MHTDIYIDTYIHTYICIYKYICILYNMYFLVCGCIMLYHTIVSEIVFSCYMPTGIAIYEVVLFSSVHHVSLLLYMLYYIYIYIYIYIQKIT